VRRVTIRSVWAHRRRLVATLVAIVLGVAFTSATFVLATTLDRAAVRGPDGAAANAADLRFFEAILNVFGVVALLVGAFVISNTFTILVAQRTRELALLRTLGASRAQIFGSVLSEAAIVGVVASAAGLLVGRSLAFLLRDAMRELGLYLPRGGLVVRADALALSLAMGVAVTLFAALLPAIRATRVPPVAALREADPADGAVRLSLRRVVLGGSAVLLGALRCAPAWRDGPDASLLATGVGAVLVVAGVLVLGPAMAGPGVGLAGRVVRPFRGLGGRLAVENAARNPGRTATTAGAVVVCTALVVFVAAFAASAVESVRSAASGGFSGDFVVTGAGGLTLPNGMLTRPIDPTVAGAVGQVRGVSVAVAMGYEEATLTFPDGRTSTPYVSSIDRAGLASVLHPRMAEGSVDDLDDGGIVLDRIEARSHGVGIGDRVGYGVQGRGPVQLRVAAISDDPNLLGHATVTRDRYLAAAPVPRDVQVVGRFAPGADPAVVLGGVRGALVDRGGVWAFSREEFVRDLTRQISSFVNVLYALLALSVLIAIVGVANTLSLTVHERTRELGLLRALGMDRAAVRSAVRWEAVVVGLLGTGIGLVVGGVLSLALIGALRDLGLVTFDLPAVVLAASALGAVALTSMAAVRPAQRAASVSILDAIASE
jgi:putative ABC transport system permease protein